MLETERCLIPMGHALPDARGRVIGWGGAGSMVHPASGYQVARALMWAPGVARQWASALAQGARGPALARRAHQAVWSGPRVRQRRFYLYGLEALLDMDLEGLEAFFEAFFALPDARWAGYLSGTLRTRELAGAMLRVFGKADPGLRRRLMRPAAGPAALDLVRGLVGSDEVIR